jgi:hypothetical protein
MLSGPAPGSFSTNSLKPQTATPATQMEHLILRLERIADDNVRNRDRISALADRVMGPVPHAAQDGDAKEASVGPAYTSRLERLVRDLELITGSTFTVIERFDTF